MVTVVIGDFGTGKTTYLKEKFLKHSKKKKLVYALISKDFGGIPTFRNFKMYMNEASKMSDSVFIVDESATALPRKEPDPTKNPFNYQLLCWFLNARKCNNSLFLVFHTMREVPIWLIAYSDYFIRFRTNDLMQHQIMRFSSFPNVVKSLEKPPTQFNKSFYCYGKKFDYDEIRVR